FGRLEFGAASPTESTNVGQVEAQVGADWTPADWVRVHVHGIAREHGSGLVEAYLDMQKDFGRDTIRLRTGEFFIPTSREHIDAPWSSPYTVSYPVLTPGMGGGLRPAGTELQWQHLGSNAVVTFAGGAFCCNDTMGTLVAWRGWSMGNRLT